MSYKKIYMSFNIKRHIHERVIFRWCTDNVLGGVTPVPRPRGTLVLCVRVCVSVRCVCLCHVHACMCVCYGWVFVYLDEKGVDNKRCDVAALQRI